MKKNDIQHVYLYIDDSGKISKYEDYAIFAGIVFYDSNQKSEFMNKYRSIINEIKCSYCEFSVGSCNNHCPEIKGMNIRNDDRRRLINLSRNYVTFGTVIINKNLNGDIINRKASKGRFSEYAQRRLIKETVKYLISNEMIDPDKSMYLHINIDEMPTKTNGYYTLQEGLLEELKHGIINFNYATTFPAIIKGDLEVQVVYRDSSKDCCIQMADILANSIRRAFGLNNNWYESSEYLKKKLRLNVLLRLPN